MSINADLDSFRGALEKIDGVVQRHAELPQQVFRVPTKGVRFVDLDELWSEDFFEVTRQLTARVGSPYFSVAVLKPDPIEYYFANFQKFPFLRFDIGKASAAGYIAALHEDPGHSPADAIIHNSDVLVVFPDNLRWLIYGDRNLEVAVIAVMDDETLRTLDEIYPNERLHSASSVIDNILPTVFDGSVPSDVRSELLRNYRD